MIEGFSELPGLIARELETRRQVVVVLLDAFGWAFVQRHERHPLLRRFAADGALGPLRSQFPSTTTAHVTTMHTGLPVEAHGLYEWRVWEPSVGEVIVPLLVSREPAYDARTALLPEGPSFYQRLAVRAGVASTVYSPARFSPSGFDQIAIRGARLVPYDDLSSIALVPSEEDKSYTYIYWDMIDAIGHRFGPSSPEFDDACLRALDGLYGLFFGPSGPTYDDTLLILTADHGQIDVSPDRVDLLTIDGAQPAGSARDLFVHVEAERVDQTITTINSELGDRGTAVHSSSLFATAGPRLLSRLAPICILPAPGRMTWLSTHTDDIQLQFRGHHGGRTAEESTTFLGMLELG